MEASIDRRPTNLPRRFAAAVRTGARDARVDGELRRAANAELDPSLAPPPPVCLPPRTGKRGSRTPRIGSLGGLVVQRAARVEMIAWACSRG